MSQRTSLFIGLMFCLVTTTAEAQNPFSGFLESINKVTKPSAQNEDSSLVDILKTYAAANTVLGAVDACSVVASGIGVQKLEADFKLGNYVNASSGYLLAAKNVAQCAVGPVGARQVTRIPLSQAINETGVTLAMSVIADKAGGLVTPQTKINAKNALTLLNVNKTANEELIRNLKETGLVGDAAPTTVSNAKSVHMTAEDAVSAYKSNNFAFKSKYDGKVLTISGTIKNISGSGQRATVTLVGNKHADLKKQSFSDVVSCVVSDQAALAKVMNLKSGAATKVTGLFKPETQALQIGIELQRCQPD
jgi:hypothetical protein